MPQSSSSPLRILYLANYAPVGGIGDQDEESVRYTRYHKEMFSLLESLGFHVTPARDVRILIEQPKSFHYVFSLLNRAPYRGSEIFVSALCEYLQLPYLGARPHIRAVAEDKYITKLIAAQIGLRVPAGKVFRATDSTLIPPSFPGPYIAKPRCGASSKYISEDSIQEVWEDLVPQVHRLLTFGDDVLVEEWIPGVNITLPVVGGEPPEVFPAYQLLSQKKGQLVTYEQKRGKEKTVKRVAYENEDVSRRVQQYAQNLLVELKPIDYLRLDFRVTGSDEPIFLEFNVCCNIGPQSGFYACARERGYSHRELLARILNYSFGRQNIYWQAL